MTVDYTPYPSALPTVGTEGLFDVVKSIGKGISHAVTGSVKTAAHAARSTVKAGSSAVKGAAHIVSQVPVVGDVTQIVAHAATSPLRVVEAVAAGQRLDHVALGALKDQLKTIKDVAPYAQTVVSMVPGVGSGVSAAIGAGAALAQGRSLDNIAKAAIRGALPGGPLAAVGFDTALKVASGENVAQSVLEGARAGLPPTAQKAFDIGLAVVHGERIQTALAKGLEEIAPGELQKVLAAGEHVVATTPGMREALAAAGSGAPAEGFVLAAGLLGHNGLSEKALTAVRNRLPADVRSGFDAALRTQTSRVAWLANVVNAPIRRPTLKAASPTPPPRPRPTLKAVAQPLPAAPRAVIAAQADRAMARATGPATAISRTSASREPPYTPYPHRAGVAGLGSFLEPDRWRWFAVYDGPRLIMQRGPVLLSDQAALAEQAGFLEATQGHSYIGAVYRWDWNSDAGRWHQAGLSDAGLAGCGGAPCGSYGPPIVNMGYEMHRAGLSAVNSGRGQSRMVSAPDGTAYRFALEGGVLTARECLR